MTEFESALDGIGKLQNSLLEKVFEQYMEFFKELEKENTYGNINYIIGDEKQNAKQNDSVTYNAKESDTVTILKPVENMEEDKPLEKDDEKVDDEIPFYAYVDGEYKMVKMSRSQLDMLNAIERNKHNLFVTYRECGFSTLMANFFARTFHEQCDWPSVLYVSSKFKLCEEFYDKFYVIFDILQEKEVFIMSDKEWWHKAIKNGYFKLCNCSRSFVDAVTGRKKFDYVVFDCASFYDILGDITLVEKFYPEAKIIVASCFDGKLQTTDKCNDFTSLYFDTLCDLNDFKLLVTDVIKDYREGFNKHFIDDYMFSDCLPNNEKKVWLLNIPNLDCSENEFKTKWIKKHFLQ